MIITIVGTIENVEKYNGKNGFGATITVSQLIEKKRSLLSFNTSSAEVASRFEDHLQDEMEIDIELSQNNFGLRLGDVVNLQQVNS